MISKAKLKELSAYKLQKNCDLDKVYVVEGVKMCGEALRENMPVRVICATRDWPTGAKEPWNDKGMEFYEVSPAELERLSGRKSPNQVWMLVSRLSDDQAIAVNEEAPLLVLDKIQDPGNLGTIIRTADWFGIRTLVCSPDTVSHWNPKVVQSTMGGVFRTRVVYTDLVPFLQQCAALGRPVCGAVLDGENVYGSRLEANTVLVIGNESRGISSEVQDCLTRRVLIPNRGGTCESLNASVATAILCSELFRG